MAALFLVFGLLASSDASAVAFEPVGHFGGIVTPPPPAKFPEEAQLGGAGGMAVNVSGSGGVKPGTLYAATRGLSGEGLRVARYEPAGDGLAFVEAWEVRPVEGPYERCGPSLATECPNRPEAPARWVDVEVNQATGNVYVFSTENLAAGDPTVAVFNPDGSELIMRFGQLAVGGATTASTPEKVHESPGPGGLAVDSSGTVYIFDLNFSDSFYHRLMVFKPTTPGNFKTYAYVAGGDMAAAFGGGNVPAKPVTDAAGDLYVAGETNIEKYTPSQPNTPICKFELKIGGITALTVNRATGEPFYYTYKNKHVHGLGACSEGKFSELGPPISVAPERAEISALAFDPSRQLEETRQAGVLYGAAPGPTPSVGGKGEPGMGALGYIFAPVEEIPPVVESEAVSGVGPTGAEVEAQINPKGSQTSFRFEYITDAAYQAAGANFGEGTLEAPEGGSVLGAGQNPLRAAAVLSGLAPDTEYHYRVVAMSNCSPTEPTKVCSDTGEAESFNTYPLQAGPPDQRAYELVSPPQKNGGQVLPAEPITSTCGLFECKPGAGYSHFPMQSALDGEAVVYEGTPFTPEGGAVIENEYISRRTALGWGTVNLTPTLMQSKGGQGYKAFDESLSEGILEQTIPSLSPFAPPEYTNLYRQPTTKPLQLNPLLSNPPPNRAPGRGSNSFETVYSGASADFSHQIFEANDGLTLESSFAPEAVDGGENESNLYEWVGGELRLVNVLPGNAETIPGAVFGSGTLLQSGGAGPNAIAVVTNAISEGGSRIFWSSKVGQLYVREDGEKTIEIKDSGKFLTASADGSKVLLSDGCLYDLAEAECEDLSAGQGGFQGIAGQSDDLSHLYFVDTAALAGSGENDQGQNAVAGKPNLYAWVEGATSFITTLLTADNQNIRGDWQASPSVRTAEASPAGRWLAFLSTAPLTGIDNVGPCVLNGETGEYADAPCSEVFLYDSATDEFTCPSCNSSGTAPLGPSVVRLIKDARGYLPQPRYLTDSGRLYFDSADSLSYFDTNAGVEDVYQYEPQGMGTCIREGGCVSLVSAGREAVDSNFLTVDATGGNVFFTSRDRLVPADEDQLIDLYDARVGGGFPDRSRGQICLGETCQPPTAIPVEAPAASQSPLGVGNYKPPKCRKGQVIRGGRCVKKPHHKDKKNQDKAKSKKHGGSK